MTKEELLAKRQQDEIRMSELDPEEDSWSRNLARQHHRHSEYLNEYQNLKAEVTAIEFATKEQVSSEPAQIQAGSRAAFPLVRAHLYLIWTDGSLYPGYQSLR